MYMAQPMAQILSNLARFKTGGADVFVLRRRLEPMHEGRRHFFTGLYMSNRLNAILLQVDAVNDTIHHRTKLHALHCIHAQQRDNEVLCAVMILLEACKPSVYDCVTCVAIHLVGYIHPTGPSKQNWVGLRPKMLSKLVLNGCTDHCC